MGISKTKKILIAVLSLILLFLVSCGDRPTGSDTGGSGKGDALVNSVPKVTGDPTQDFSTDTTYNATLTIVDTKEDTDFTDDFLKSFQKTREELINEEKPKNVILTITKNTAGNNIVKFSEQSTATEGSGFPKEYPLFENAELKKDSSGKYNAGVENPTENGTQVYYIEFDTTTTTSKIKFVNAISQNVDWGDIGSKYTYEGHFN